MKITKSKTSASDLDYQVNIIFDHRDGLYLAKVPELENCEAKGNSPEEALKNARSAIQSWVNAAKRKKMTIPTPLSQKKYSGKFLVRIPQGLHEKLALKAYSSDKSLNEVVTQALNREVSQHKI